MDINICHRLLKQQIENGTKYVENGQPVLTEIPLGLYSTKKYKEGDVIRELRGEMLLNPTRESIHIGNGLHVVDECGKYMNHSFEPNTKIELNKVIATRNIEKYEELTFNYNSTEINMACPFTINGQKVSGRNE